MPSYVRVPIILAVNGSVHATIEGGDENPLSVSLAPAAATLKAR
jgi:hypothetical protein